MLLKSSASNFTTLVALLSALSPSVKASADTFSNKCTAAVIGSEIQRANPAAEVNIIEYVAAGTNITFPDNDPSCNRPAQVVTADICRIAMNVNTSSTSQITMEAWLPRKWTGRFLSTGNGGLAGCKYNEPHDFYD